MFHTLPCRQETKNYLLVELITNNEQITWVLKLSTPAERYFFSQATLRYWSLSTGSNTSNVIKCIHIITTTTTTFVGICCCSSGCRASGTLALTVSNAQYHRFYLVRIWQSLRTHIVATSSCLPLTTHQLLLVSLCTHLLLCHPAFYDTGNLIHSARASRFCIFLYCQCFPTTNAACAHFRHVRKIGHWLGAVTFSAWLTALKDILNVAKAMHSDQVATICAKLRSLADEAEAVRPILLTNLSHFASSNLFNSVLMHQTNNSRFIYIFHIIFFIYFSFCSGFGIFVVPLLVYIFPPFALPLRYMFYTC